MGLRGTRILERFNSWFTSAAGVYQTTFVVLGVSVLEFVFRDLDPHAFLLMAVLTVYSGITQPLLAYVSAKSSKSTDRILDRIEEMMADEFVVDKATHELAVKILEEVRSDCRSGDKRSIERRDSRRPG